MEAAVPIAEKFPTLLVVDDEEGPRQSLRIVFHQDYHILLARNADEAVAQIKSHPVDIAILDIRMAGLSGIGLLEQIKRLDPTIEVIMLTAYETIETARQALRHGACDYLSKPFDLSTIREAAARAMHLRKISRTVIETADRLKKLTDQLHDTALREEMARTTSEIYAGVLHDINNPLTVISGYVEMLEHRLARVGALHGADLDSVRDDIATIAKQVGTCSAIATRYLRFLNKRQARLQEVSINQVLADVQTLLKNHPSAKQSQIAIKSLPSDAFAQIGGTELIQIILNLVINAFQSTAQPQTVWITAEKLDFPLTVPAAGEPAGELAVGRDTFANEPPLVALSIIDQGPGIPHDLLPKVFEPYFTTKEQDGTGLGLSIVSRLVSTHHGLIHVKTSADDGTRVTVYLPARQSNSANPFKT